MSGTWQPQAGECLLIDSGPSGKHLFIILLVNDDQVLSVPICTLRDQARADPACLIQFGEHKFVVEESFIEYRNARLDRVDHLIKCVNELTFIPHTQASVELVNKAREGLKKSAFVKRYLKDIVAKT